jgi:hypothetical protein
MNIEGLFGANGNGAFDFSSLVGGPSSKDSEDFNNLLAIFSGNASSIDGIGFQSLVQGFSQFGGDVDGIIPYDQAYGLGFSSGSNLLSLIQGTPLASLPSPANMDPTAQLLGVFGLDRGVLSFIGEGIEESTPYLDEIGFGAGTIFAFATNGGAGAGTYARLGATAGTLTAGHIDATSDAGVGILDLDGKETRDQNNGFLALDFLSN